MKDSVFDAIGKTPLVKLSRVSKELELDVYAKLEYLNPGGSAKDRAAIQMIREGIRLGLIKEGTTVIESSSGNMAISLAQICLYYRLPFICVVDPKTTAFNLSILRAYQARIELVDHPDPHTGEYLPARLRRVKELLEEAEDAYWPNQYANAHNAQAHYSTTMREIAEELPDTDYLFCGVSTCGTIHGCASYIRDHALAAKVIAVDAAGSNIFNPTNNGRRRLLPGLGAALKPQLAPPEEWLAGVIYVSDQECADGCRKLMEQEAIMAGGSSGGVLSALYQYRSKLPAGARCVVILPDRGERYLDTVYSNEWLEGISRG